MGREVSRTSGEAKGSGSTSRIGRGICRAALLCLLPFQAARADFIPYGAADYSEIVGIGVTSTITGETLYASFITGSSPDLAETVSDSYTIYVPGEDPPMIAGTAHAHAETTAGSGTTPPSVFMMASSLQAYFDDADVQASASVDFEATLVKLHPDAPDDIPIPLTVVGSVSGVGSLEIGNAGGLVVDADAMGGSLDIDTDFSLLPYDGIGIELSATTGGTLFGNNDLSGSGSGPVFAIDPDFRVPFGTETDPGRTERAIDLYSLAYPGVIGFAGSFNTVTPLDDGCLGDPGILAPDGSPSVVSGSTVTCRKVDPSGFRTYGNVLGDPGGVLDGLRIDVEEDATVQTNVNGNIDPENAATFGLLGEGNTLTNDGEILALGEVSNAIYAEGDAFDLVNRGRIASQGEESEVIWILGDEAGVLNQGAIESEGFFSSGVVVEGDGAFVSNEGSIATSGAISSGVVIEGDFATLDNSGSVDTQAPYAAGLVVLGNDSVGDLSNRGSVETLGGDAWGMLVLGQRHSIRNDGGGSATIATSGARAHGIALGLQEVTLPPGAEIPPEAFLPASGSIANAGAITTSGDEADAIHAYANGLPVTNSGDLETSGTEAHGISVVGDDAVVANAGGASPGTIVTSGRAADGIAVEGDAPEVTNEGDITATGSAAAAIRGAGDDGRYASAGNITAGRAGAQSSRGIEVTGDRLRVTNTGTIVARGDSSIGIRAGGVAAVVANGDASHRAARIDVEGEGADGLLVSSSAPAVVNEGGIAASGVDSTGMSVTAGSASTFQVTSSGPVSVSGIGARAIVLSTSDGLGTGVASGLAPACAVIGDGTSKLVNCGQIRFPDSPLGGGMVADDVRNATIENQGSIVGDGQGARGIFVDSLPGFTGDRNNLVSNVDAIEVTGPNAVGIEVSGENNVVLQGNGVIRLPSDPFEDPLDLQDVFGRELYPNAPSYANEFTRDAPSGTVLPIGRVVVSGTGAVGVSIAGSGNRVGQVFSGQADDSRIEARGAGSIGVKLAGIGNLFVNGGTVIGDGVGILGGSGSDSVTNQNSVEGGIDLAGGPDRLVVDAGSRIVGIADGGLDRDELVFFVPDGASHAIDGDQYANFEDLWKLGAGDLLVTNTLRGDDLLLEVGELELAPGARLETSGSSIHVRERGRLSGGGTAVGSLLVEGGVLSPGSGLGTLTLDGDLSFEDGLLEIQIGGAGPGESDLLEVLGSASFLDGDLLFAFEGDFRPDVGETIDFLAAEQILGLENLGVGYAGLPDGYQFDLATTAGGLQLVTTAVPEPSVLILLLATALGWGRLAGCGRERSTGISSGPA